MISKFWAGVLLFSLLGAMLSAIGITLNENPVSFICIVLIALLIDLNASRA